LRSVKPKKIEIYREEEWPLPNLTRPPKNSPHLDYSEIAFWWLLSFKARLKLAGRIGRSRISVGHTVFYAPITDNITSIGRARYELLEAMDVDVIPLDIEPGFEYAYHLALNDISRYKSK